MSVAGSRISDDHLSGNAARETQEDLILSGERCAGFAAPIRKEPLLRPRKTQLWLLGVALYLIGSTAVWTTDALPHGLNTALSFRRLAGLLLLVPIAAVQLERGASRSGLAFQQS